VRYDNLVMKTQHQRLHFALPLENLQDEYRVAPGIRRQNLSLASLLLGRNYAYKAQDKMITRRPTGSLRKLSLGDP